MSIVGRTEFVDRFFNDAAFREAMMADPEGTLRNSGFALDENEIASIKTMEWAGSDEQLAARVSKGILQN